MIFATGGVFENMQEEIIPLTTLGHDPDNLLESGLLPPKVR
jgi:hypothetical protein